MATSNTNRVVYGAINGQGFHQALVPVSHSTFPFNQGDLLYLDTTAHLAKPLDSDAHGATILGVALEPSNVSSNLDNGVVSHAATSALVGWDMIANLKTTAADVYHTGDVVYAGADAGTVSLTGTNAVGVCILPYGVATVTGATNVVVAVRILNKALTA